ncbi:MAG TPA: tetratricopeptide repeat protein [bacterium]|nr:tetratricopeptide repeat protein [bacterium]
MKRRIVKVIVMAIMCVAVRQVLAQGDAGQAGAFLNYGVGGRAMGMGRAFVAVSDDASGSYWNPAGLVGARRMELSTTYTNLYYDTQFAHLGLVIPRPGRTLKDKVARFLVGPSTAVGFGWVGLSMTGFEQRSSTREYLGDFGLSENAFISSWAREEVGSWGIFRYGINLKFVHQDFSGLQNSGSMDMAGSSTDWSGGIDVGMIFQPIHAPVFRIFSLRYLLPLKIGFSVQNLVQPSWKRLGMEKDPFPTIIRWGLSYRWVIKDWVPDNWKGLRSLFGNTQILLAFDREYLDGRQTGTYFGAEGQFIFSESGFALFPRVGINNRTEGTALGIGFCMPFTSNALIRIDYAYGFHPFLDGDNRFFMTLQMGPGLGPSFFRQMSEKTDLPNKEIRQYLLRVIADYPNEYVIGAVNKITQISDSAYARRYFDLTGGLGLANSLFHESWELMKEGRISRAQKKAEDASNEYAIVFTQPEHAMTDSELLNYGEALIIAQRMGPAISVLTEVEQNSLRRSYLMGLCYKALGEWSKAINSFSEAVRLVDTEMDLANMAGLSFLGLGQALVRMEQYETARVALEKLIDKYAQSLDENYPRYPAFRDGYIVDDAQYLLGLTYLLEKQYEEGVASLLRTALFYPNMQYGQLAESNTGNFIQLMQAASWDLMDNLVDRLLNNYFDEHGWPPTQ